MPRPKTTPIDLLRTKAWAHACARIIGDTEQATTYRLSIESTSFLKDRIESLPAGDRDTYPKSIDNGRWSRWLRGLRGVERKIVLALDALCPGTAKVYDIGPEAGPWIQECGAVIDISQENLYYKHLIQSTNIPLWAAMKGNSTKTLEAWKNVDPQMWISWTPDKLRLTDAWIEWEQFQDPGDSEEIADPEWEDFEAEFGSKGIRPKQQFIYSPDKWSWWIPSDYHFADFNALKTFLWEYITANESHPMLLIAAMLSVGSTEYDAIGWRAKLYLKNFLSPYGMSIDDIFANTAKKLN